MHAFGGIVMDTSCGVWWIGGTALINGDGFYVGQGEVVEE